MEERKKVKASIVGADGNVFNLIGICQRSLKDAGLRDEAQELQTRVMSSKSYDEALQIMMEYIDPVDQNYNDFEDRDFDENIDI